MVRGEWFYCLQPCHSAHWNVIYMYICVCVCTYIWPNVRLLYCKAWKLQYYIWQHWVRHVYYIYYVLYGFILNLLCLNWTGPSWAPLCWACHAREGGGWFLTVLFYTTSGPPWLWMASSSRLVIRFSWTLLSFFTVKE